MFNYIMDTVLQPNTYCIVNKKIKIASNKNDHYHVFFLDYISTKLKCTNCNELLLKCSHDCCNCNVLQCFFCGYNEESKCVDSHSRLHLMYCSQCL